MAQTEDMEFVTPVGIDYPDRFSEESVMAPTPLQTLLFRFENYLPQALHEARRRSDAAAAFSFASIGCSNGAEVDSMLALCNRDGLKGVDATGYDIVGRALDEAREGRYIVYSGGEEALRALGFATALRGEPGQGQAYMEADAAPVREGHTVRFVEHDARMPIPVRTEVNLALANNLIYHWKNRDTAARILRNVAGILTERGVLDIGTTLEGTSPIDTEYREYMVDLLDDEFELKPSFTDVRGVPVLFARA